MKSKNNLKEQSVLHLLSQNNFIIPEIQREYIWGNNEKVIKSFLKNIKEKAGVGCLECGTPKNPVKLNIGFLYTYKPEYVSANPERFLDENLIDGQQRFTTLFLLLFFCALKENRQDDFISLVRYERLIGMGFDYRVRDLTHRFLLELVENVTDIAQLESIGNQTWFLKDYKYDVSISSIRKAFKIISEEFKDQKHRYFDYILNYVRFWHFKTEATSQGEELYITMNARGEALSKNEEAKAGLMLDPISQFQNGKDWEEWQHFFWINRGNNVTADKGFNEFLRWVQIIKMAEKNSGANIDSDQPSASESDIVKLIQADKIDISTEHFDLEDIKKYFIAVQEIFESYPKKIESLRAIYPIEIDLLPKLLLHPFSGSIKQAECFKLLPVLYYCKLIQDKKQVVDPQMLFRIMRFLNNLSDDVTIAKTINKQVLNALKMVGHLVQKSHDIVDLINLEISEVSRSILTNEERFKFSIYKTHSTRELCEKSFWSAEDNLLNEGKIGHLIQATYYDSSSIEKFEYSKNFSDLKSSDFKVEFFNKLFNNFSVITENRKSLSDHIWGGLLLTNFYSIKKYNTVSNCVECQHINDEAVIQNKHFLKFLFELKENQTAQEFFKNIEVLFFEKYNSIETLKEEKDSRMQLYLYQLCFLSIKPEDWNWNKGRNFGIYDRIIDDEFYCFFKNKMKYQHYKQRWVGSENNYFNQTKETIKIIEEYISHMYNFK